MTMSMCNASTKHVLRQWALGQMKAMPKHTLLQKSQCIVDNLKKVGEFKRARHIFTCLSFGNEVDTWSLVEELRADSERKLYVPRVGIDGSVHVHPYPCKLRPLRMGLQQPAPGEFEIPPKYIDSLLDIGLIVGLAFERNRGYRLGYGKGFFDMFLAGRTFFTIGLSFECLLVDHMPTEPHDIPMRMIVTEDRIYRCEPMNCT